MLCIVWIVYFCGYQNDFGPNAWLICIENCISSTFQALSFRLYFGSMLNAFSTRKLLLYELKILVPIDCWLCYSILYIPYQLIFRYDGSSSISYRISSLRIVNGFLILKLDLVVTVRSPIRMHPKTLNLFTASAIYSISNHLYLWLPRFPAITTTKI